jgi:hypothetical protein
MAYVFFHERLFSNCKGFRRSFSEICTKFDAVPLSGPSRNHIGPDTRLAIKGRKNEHIHPAL